MGNAFRLRRTVSRYTVHPHVHGERCRIPRRLRSLKGSSPRAWGTPSRVDPHDLDSRFIPTCMGNAFRPLNNQTPVWVHPHVHGERPTVKDTPKRSAGSSPRAWGTLRMQYMWCFRARFIPTCMGNAVNLEIGLCCISVHPHVHGERMEVIGDDSDTRGSSPRAWGTPAAHSEPLAWTRFIPTCMGNAEYSEPAAFIASVHPHVHGERNSFSIFIVIIPGSSPRAWGTRYIRENRTGIAAVHPHVHGERVFYGSIASFRGGSSPRAWGTLQRAQTPRDATRFIPTCMGNANLNVLSG